jgi:hypothetical protein
MVIPVLTFFGVCAIWILINHNTLITTDRQERENARHESLSGVDSAIQLYIYSENNGIIPAFSSLKLPKWWSIYGKGVGLQSDVVYEIPTPLVGRHVSAIKGRIVIALYR